MSRRIPNSMIPFEVIGIMLVAGGIFLFALVAIVAGALSDAVGQTVNDHKHIWYAPQCCNGKDCEPLPDGRIKESGLGYLDTVTGELINFGDSRVRKSQDGHYHRCANASTPARAICIYVPERFS